MITPQLRGYLLSCDYCSTETKIQAEDFPTAIKKAHEKGWTMTVGPGGRPKDRCPCCNESLRPQHTAYDSPTNKSSS